MKSNGRYINKKLLHFFSITVPNQKPTPKAKAPEQANKASFLGILGVSFSLLYVWYPGSVNLPRMESQIVVVP